MKTITLILSLSILMLLSNCNNKNQDYFKTTETQSNIALFLIPKGECINCKTMLYKNSYIHLQQQYPFENIFFLFPKMRKIEAKRFLTFNIDGFNENNIITDNDLYHHFFNQLHIKEASIVIIDHKKNILLQRPIKSKVIRDYNFLTP